MYRQKTSSITLMFGLLSAVSIGLASDPDWESMNYTPHHEYQAVDTSGNGTFLPSPPIKMRGIMLCNPEDLLDGTPGAPAFMGGQWQIFFQADNPADWGGTACWVGQYYGNLPWVPPTESYSDAEWLAELDRLNHDPISGHLFRAGDLIEVRARVPGLNYQGKTNINEGHTKNLTNDFDVHLLQADVGIPEPRVIPDLQTANIFDATRLSGGEYYQSTWVRMNSVEITSGTWGAGNILSISDGTDSFDMLLSPQGDFNNYTSPTGKFDVLGIFDQESQDPTTGYRLWVLRYNHIIQPTEAPELIQAVSRKTHNNRGDFDINLPLDTPVGVECRQGGPTTVILTFNEGIKVIDGTPDESEVNLSEGSLQSIMIDSQEMILDIADVPNSSTLTITITDITDLADNLLAGDNDVQISAKTGDVRPDGVVNIFDLGRVKYHLFQDLNSENCVADVNLDGVINIFDMGAVQSRLFQ